MVSSDFVEPIIAIIVHMACSTFMEGSIPSISWMFWKLEDSNSSTITLRCSTQLSNSVVSSLLFLFFFLFLIFLFTSLFRVPHPLRCQRYLRQGFIGIFHDTSDWSEFMLDISSPLSWYLQLHLGGELLWGRCFNNHWYMGQPSRRHRLILVKYKAPPISYF